MYGALWGMGLGHYSICWTGLLTEYVYANIFDNIFGVTVDVNISVMDTLVQSFKTLGKQTHVSPLCAHSMGSPLIYRPTSTLTHWGIVTYIWWQNSGHHCFRQWLNTSLMQSQCLNQWLYIVNWTHRKKLCDISTTIQIFSIQNIELNGTYLVQA